MCVCIHVCEREYVCTCVYAVYRGNVLSCISVSVNCEMKFGGDSGEFNISRWVYTGGLSREGGGRQAGRVCGQPSAFPVVSALPRALLSLPLFLWSTRPANWEKGLLGVYWHQHQHHAPSWRKYACKGMWLLWLLQSSAVSVLGHWRLLEITGNYWRLLTLTRKALKCKPHPCLHQMPNCQLVVYTRQWC